MIHRRCDSYATSRSPIERTSIDRTYDNVATHHGKEEDIFFDVLFKIKLSEVLLRIMNQLLGDHKTSRESIHTLDDVNLQYTQGYHAVIKEILKSLHQLITSYPPHINIENQRFFFPVIDFFIPGGRDTML